MIRQRLKKIDIIADKIDMKAYYFLLKTNPDPEVKGVDTGCGQVELDRNNPITEKLEDFFFSQHYWRENRKFPDFNIENCTASLLSGAKLTDFLDFSPGLLTCQFMISERLAEVFSKFNIQQYVTYPVTLYDHGQQLSDKYYIFCCPLLGYDVIDFAQSVFYKKERIFEEKTYLHYENSKQYIDNYVVGNQIEKLVFNSNFDRSLDYFHARIGGIHISEALKDAIEILGFTGVQIFNTEHMIIV